MGKDLQTWHGAGRFYGICMYKHGLSAPDLDFSKEYKFYFTKAGWEKVGRAIVEEALERGHCLRIISEDVADAECIAYQDKLQIAVDSASRDRKATAHMKAAEEDEADLDYVERSSVLSTFQRRMLANLSFSSVLMKGGVCDTNQCT